MFLNFLNKREQKDFIELVKLSFEHSSPMNGQEERFMNALRVETELQKYEFKDVPYEELIMHFQSSTKKVKRELNPMSWSKSNSWGFLMFSKEIQIEAVSMYLKGVPPVAIRQKFGIKAHSTLEIWVNSIRQDGIYGIKDSHRNKTSYPYSFKIKVINWRLNHNASYPITARKFRITSPSLIWHWERALESGRLKPDKRRRKRTMNKQEHDKIKKLEEENELLRIKVAYLEKLEALAQEKKKLQTKTKR